MLAFGWAPLAASVLLVANAAAVRESGGPADQGNVFGSFWGLLSVDVKVLELRSFGFSSVWIPCATRDSPKNQLGVYKKGGEHDTTSLSERPKTPI